MDHFKQEQVATKHAKLSGSAETNKKPGKLQKTAYLVCLGLLPIGRLWTHHLQAMHTELVLCAVVYGDKDGICKLSDLFALLHKHKFTCYVLLRSIPVNNNGAKQTYLSTPGR